MNSNSNNSSPPTTSSSSRPSASQACAACKYQRRKCNPDCILAPYFPADHQRQFLNAHRLFGVSNILKIIRGLDPQRRSTAMKSIIFQSDMRAHDPVGGCYRLILDLERQYDHDCHELAIVLHQLALCRQAAAASHAQPAGPSSLLPPNLEIDATATIEDVMYENNFMVAAATHHQKQQQQYYDYFYFDGSGSGGGENNIENDHNININSAAAISSNSVNNNNNNNNVDINGNANEVDMEVPQSTFSLHHHQEQEEHEDDVKQLVDMFDTTHALAIGDAGEITSKAADLDLAAGSYHLSTEIQAKREEANPMEHVQEHDLKGAASLFTLTSRDSSYV